MSNVEVQPGIVVGGTVLTVPVPAEAQEAIDRWHAERVDELAAILKPFGLHPYMIGAPAYHRVVTSDDIVR